MSLHKPFSLLLTIVSSAILHISAPICDTLWEYFILFIFSLLFLFT